MQISYDTFEKWKMSLLGIMHSLFREVMMRTGISELDEMIGLPNPGEGSEEISRGKVILIRGEPGSGKTTLGLQILSNFIQNINLGLESQGKAASPESQVMFISLEQDPQQVLAKVQDAFLFFHNITTDEILKFDRTAFDAFLRKIMSLQRDNSWKVDTDTFTGFKKFAQEVFTDTVVDNKRGSKLDGLVISFVMNIFSQLSAFKENEIAIETIEESKNSLGNIKLILLDSLDVFIEIIRKFQVSASERLIINAIHQSLMEICPDAVVIFIGEYHYWDVNKDTAVSESFLCDIEISLFSEPTVVPPTWNAQYASPLGNNYLSLLKKESNSLHTQSFCRVLKSRDMQNQSRRCSYDILTGKGLEFFPSYPGDGHFLIFTENEPQQSIWKNFWEKDVPVSYPSLRYENFDRISMQRTSNIWRRVRYCVPTRTDLVLASFDNYWINWYDEIFIKWMILDSMQQLNLDKYYCNKKDDFYRWINFIGSAVLAQEIKSDLLAGLDNSIGLRCIRCYWIEHILLEALANIVDPPEREKFLISFTELYEKFNKKSKAGVKIKAGCVTEAIIDKKSEIVKDLSGDIIKAIYNERGNQSEECHWVQLAGVGKKKSAKPQIDLISRIFSADTYTRSIRKLWTPPVKGNTYHADVYLLYTLLAMKLTEPVENRTSMLLPVPVDDLRLFGERRSDLIKPLDRVGKEELRPICRPRLFGSWKSKSKILSVPYNANVSFYIHQPKDYRDYLQKIKSGEAIPETDLSLPEWITQITSLIRSGTEEKISADEWTEYLNSQQTPENSALFFKTWEEIIAYAFCTKKQIVLETQTLDSFLSTLLEIFWSCGGRLSNNSDYTLSEKPEEVKDKFKKAFRILALLFGMGIVSADSACEVEAFARKYNPGGPASEPGWLLVRHWYSTFIDLLSAKDKEGNFIWKINGDPRHPVPLEIMPVPTTMGCLTRTPLRYEKGLSHSCMGDWHFAIIKGSENEKLGIDLINNLMSSERICERAFTNADVPTVKEFYELYGKARCINPSLRNDIQLPRTTYDDLLESYLQTAFYRSQIYDYHHCMREFHSILEMVRGMDFGNVKSAAELQKQSAGSFKEIDDAVDKKIKRITEDFPGMAFLSV